jgi:hypothetical protein
MAIPLATPLRNRLHILGTNLSAHYNACGWEWEPIPGIKSKRNQRESEMISGAETVPQCSTSLNRMYSLISFVNSFQRWPKSIRVRQVVRDFCFIHELLCLAIRSLENSKNKLSPTLPGSIFLSIDSFWHVKIMFTTLEYLQKVFVFESIVTK